MPGTPQRDLAKCRENAGRTASVRLLNRVFSPCAMRLGRASLARDIRNAVSKGRDIGNGKLQEGPIESNADHSNLQVGLMS